MYVRRPPTGSGSPARARGSPRRRSRSWRGRELFSLPERPELLQRRGELGDAWEEFMYHDAVANVCWDRQYEEFPDLQLFLLDDGDRLMAESNAVPIPFGPDELPDDGWDAALGQAFAGRRRRPSRRSRSPSASTGAARGLQQGRCSTRCGTRRCARGLSISSPRSGRAEARLSAVADGALCRVAAGGRQLFDAWLRVRDAGAS